MNTNKHLPPLPLPLLPLYHSIIRPRTAPSSSKSEKCVLPLRKRAKCVLLFYFLMAAVMAGTAVKRSSTRPTSATCFVRACVCVRERERERQRETERDREKEREREREREREGERERARGRERQRGERERERERARESMCACMCVFVGVRASVRRPISATRCVCASAYVCICV